jgi:hypothetical protein
MYSFAYLRFNLPGIVHCKTHPKGIPDICARYYLLVDTARCLYTVYTGLDRYPHPGHFPAVHPEKCGSRHLPHQ